MPRMAETFILIAGRTSRQGCGVSRGKQTDAYRGETTRLKVAPEDFARLDLAEGDRVRLRTAWGQAEVEVAPAEAGQLPPGVLFIAYGDLSSRLTNPETDGSGMPTSKAIDVVLERIS